MGGSGRRKRQPLIALAAAVAAVSASLSLVVPLADASFLSRCSLPDPALFSSRHCRVDYMTTNPDSQGGDANIDAALGSLPTNTLDGDAACLAALRGLLCPAVFRVCEPIQLGGSRPHRLCSSLR